MVKFQLSQYVEISLVALSIDKTSKWVNDTRPLDTYIIGLISRCPCWLADYYDIRLDVNGTVAEKSFGD